MLFCFSSLKFEVFFTSKALFEMLRFYNLRDLKYHDIIKCLNMKQEINFTE